MLQNPSDAVLRPDGSVAVVDWRGGRVLILDSLGRYQSTLGGRGAGPGEYLVPRQVGLAADSVTWVSDRSNGRVTLFDPAGRVIETYTRRYEQIPGTRWFAQGAWYLAGGAVVGEPTAPSDLRSEVDPARELPLVFWRAGADALTVLDWIPAMAPQGARIKTSRELRDITTGQFIPAWPLIDVEPTGRWLFALQRHPPDDGHGTITITRYAPSGSVLDTVRVPYEARPVDERVRSWLRLIAEQYEFREDPRVGHVDAADVLAAAWVPDYLPPVQQVLADSIGYWIERERTYSPNSTSQWERYDLAGRRTARVQLPSGFQGLVGAPDRLLGVTWDSMAVPVLRLYRFHDAGG